MCREILSHVSTQYLLDKESGSYLEVLDKGHDQNKINISD